jgi:hypothetical protein
MRAVDRSSTIARSKGKLGMNSDGKMRLAAYYNPTGHHVASWRHPRAQADASTNIKHYVEITQTAPSLT